MAESLTHFLQQYRISPLLIIFLISMMPILELRGGLIAASILGVPWATAMFFCILGNIIPVPFIIFFIERILQFLQKHGPIKKLATAIETKGRRAGDKMQAKHPNSVQIGLFFFTAIPLPGTGAWTASLAAALLGVKPKKSALPIGLGVLAASLIMSVITYLIPGAFGLKS